MILALTNDALRILPVRDALESYLAGRVKAERLVIAVSAEYYQEARDGRREALQPLIDVIDRASPGIVELGTVQGGSGFAISLAERPFPKQYEAELRRAAEAVLRKRETGKRETYGPRKQRASGVGSGRCFRSPSA